MAYGDALAADVRVEGPVPVMSSGGITGCHNVPNTLAPCIVVGRKGSYGSIHWSDVPAFVIDTAYVIDRRFTSCDLRWLYYALRSVDLRGMSQDVGVPGLSREAAYGVALPRVPPPDEQRRIADFLDDQVARLDRAIQLRGRTRVMLGQRTSSLTADSISGRTLGDVLNHPVIGQVNANWPVLALKRVVPRIGVGVVVNPSSYFAEGGVPFIHGGNVRDGWFELNGVRRIAAIDSAALHRSRLDQGDVVVVRAGYPGRAAVVTQKLAGANCASVLLLKRGSKVLPEWLERFFNGPQGRAQVALAQYGAAQEQINVGDVVDFLLPVPPMAMQQMIMSTLSNEISSIQRTAGFIDRQVALLRERRAALITAAVTGQFDVTAARAAA